MFSKTEALQCYRKLFLIRAAEEKICEEYPHNEMKTPVHLSVGAEAIATGVLQTLSEDSRIFGSYRNHALYLARTGDTRSFFGELFGKQTGCAQGRAGSMHLSCPEKGLILTSAVVATTIPVAVGMALAQAYRGKQEVVAVFFGDGAVEEGAFWESLNFACLKKLRVLFICEDNDLAIHTPACQRQGFRSIPEAIAGFRCHTASGEGYDAEKVYEATRKILKKMQADPRPCFLHFKYFRFSEHVGVGEDYAAGYRLRPSPEMIGRLDPVKVAVQWLERCKVTEKEKQSIEREVRNEIEQAVREAREAVYPRPEKLLKSSGEILER